MHPLILILFALCLPVGLASAEPERRETSPGMTPCDVPRQRVGLDRTQALRLIRESGFLVVRLAQDDEGIWLAEVLRGSELVDVAVDPDGNVIVW